MRQVTKGRFRWAAWTTLLVFVATLSVPALAPVPAAADARDELAKAEDYFLVADFGTALEKVDGLLSSGSLTGDGLRDAYVLKARCELGLVHRSSAVDAFCNALRIDPQWRPDPDFYTTDELEVFGQARETCGTTGSGPVSPGGTPAPMAPSARAASSGGGAPWYTNKGVLAAAGGVVVVGLLLALSGGGSDGGASPLPGFPDPPTSSPVGAGAGR
jgi:hypothetical protein